LGKWGGRGNGAVKCVSMQVNAKMIPVETTPGMGAGG
jgi:hypothetical protein